MRSRSSALRDDVTRLLALTVSDEEIRAKLEIHATEAEFRALTWLWGPRLYERGRVFWRPFILNRFDMTSNWAVIEWKGEVGKALESWLAKVDRDGDVELFRRLYGWKLAGNWQKSAEMWRGDLVRQFEAAADSAQRNIVLSKFDLWQSLDEDTAVRLYRLDPNAAGPFALKHLPVEWGWLREKRKRWMKLSRLAEERGDEEFVFSLYRQQVPIDEWQRDVTKLCDDVPGAAELVDELKKRHPRAWGSSLGAGFVEIVKRRGRDVMPYVMPNLRSAFAGWGAREGFKPLVRLALENEWFDLWAATMRAGATQKEYDDEVAMLAASPLPDNEAARRLVMLTGASREWNFGPFSLAVVHSLSDKTALAVYERFPELVRGPLRMNVGSRWGSDVVGFTKRVIEAEDEVMIDYLAGRSAMTPMWGGKPESADLLADYFERLADDPVRFCRRAASALGQIPAYAIWSYGHLVEGNRLARILFERSRPFYLEDPASLRDLLESAQIHVQALAFRVLGQDDDRARTLAAENVDLLQATLVRPLHRKTRLAAFRALANAASEEGAARVVVGRAREALDLPDKRYPKEELIGLIGVVLARWPSLRCDRERRIVFGEEVA